MGLSKSRRMQILLVVSFAFFLLELGVGVWVHSLALVADSFHMFNDVLSLCVGIWAVNVAQSKSNSKMYTYGWQRAETLGALINGVFLVALCCSIFLEAIQRFVDVPEVKNPKWILGVGSAGLIMNILGLFLFHDHGHGGHSHDEQGGKDSKRRQHNHDHASEQGLNRSGQSSDTAADESGTIADVLPEARMRAADEVAVTSNGASSVDISPRKGQNVSFQTDGSSPAAHSSRRYSSRRRSRGYSTLSADIAVHPASLRNSVIAAGRLQGPSSDDESDIEEQAIQSTDNLQATQHTHETTPLLRKRNSGAGTNNHSHSDHHHAKPKTPGQGGHGHGHGHDLNMRAVFLHVLGDALGNIGVIATALFIWLSPYKWRFYADPVISLVITCIILYSALPLCRAASRILLQAVPHGLNVDEIKADILSLRGIVGVHHLHVWQLSDTKLVASLHVRVSFDFKGEGSAEYMELARQVRSCLHGYGIHSSTIQPEFFCKDIDGGARGNGNGKSTAVHKHAHYAGDEDDSCSHEDTSSERARGRANFDGSNAACLLDCDDECGDGGKCCDTTPSS